MAVDEYVISQFPDSDRRDEKQKIQVLISIAVIEKNRIYIANSLHYSEGQILGDIANESKKRKLTEKDLKVVNSRIIGKK